MLLLEDSACSHAAGEGGMSHAGLWSPLRIEVQVRPGALPVQVRCGTALIAVWGTGEPCTSRKT